MLSVLSLVQAWVRIGLIPAVLFLLVAQIRPPLLGWPRQDRSATIAAWLLVACVPVSGLARLGVCLGCTGQCCVVATPWAVARTLDCCQYRLADGLWDARTDAAIGVRH